MVLVHGAGCIIAGERARNIIVDGAVGQTLDGYAIRETVLGMIDDHAPARHDPETSSEEIIEPRSEGEASGDDARGDDAGDHDLVSAPSAFPSPAPVLPKIPEISQKSSPRRSPTHFVYTKRLHNGAADRGLNPEKTTINCQAGSRCSTATARWSRSSIGKRTEFNASASTLTG